MYVDQLAVGEAGSALRIMSVNNRTWRDFFFSKPKHVTVSRSRPNSIIFGRKMLSNTETNMRLLEIENILIMIRYKGPD